MAHLWQGVLKEYEQFMPDYLKASNLGDALVTMREGGTPFLRASFLEELTGASRVFVKYEGVNPTGSFKDRGMTAAMSNAKAKGAKAVVCASTGNTSASAAAFAVRAGLQCAVLVPDGKIAMGKLSQAIAAGAHLLQVEGNFDDCLDLARKLSTDYPVELVNSVNPARIEGQKTASFEIVDELGDAPDIHCLPVGNAGNITAYWKGYKEYNEAGKTTKLPQMWGFQAAGAAPIVLGHVVEKPETIATAIRIGNPASWKKAEAARDESKGVIESVTDEEILEAHKLLSTKAGIFVEPASAAGVAGLIKKAKAGQVPAGATISITVTGHGLKDPQWAVRGLDGVEVTPTKISVDEKEAAEILDL